MSLSDLDWENAVDLDVDLNEAIPCEWPACNTEATWRGTSVHRDSSIACCTEHYCGVCKPRVDEYVARSSRPTCTHERIVWVRWRPLNPAKGMP